MNKFVNKIKYYEKIKLNSKLSDKEKKNIRFPLSGIFEVSLKDINFDALTVRSDDSSIVDRYFNENFYDFSLEKWFDWSKDPGLFIDVGSPTGFYSLVSLKSSPRNLVIAVEALPINYYRILTNFRLNKIDFSRVKIFNLVITDEDKIVRFESHEELSYTSKGGRISNNGFSINAIRLDSLEITDLSLKVRGIKIDTEGEDLKVIQGGINLITKFKPKIIIEARKENAKEINDFFLDLGYRKIYDAEKSFSPGQEITFQSNEISKDIFFEY